MCIVVEVASFVICSIMYAVIFLFILQVYIVILLFDFTETICEYFCIYVCHLIVILSV